MRRRLTDKLNSPYINYLVISFIIISLFWVIMNQKDWKKEKGVIYYDVISYYAYLPAAFIHNDLTLSFLDAYKGDYKLLFWPLKTKDNKRVMKMSLGLSIMYAPFFFIAHIAANALGYIPDGFSPPYKIALLIGALFYLSIGLLFLRKFLIKFYSENIIAITLTVLVAGTNLYYYSSFEGAMPHVFNFSLFALFLFFTDKWHERPNLKNSLAIGLISGLISVIRPTNIVIVLFFILYQCNSFSDIRTKFVFFIHHYKKIILIAVFSVAVWAPQFAYWKIATGHWIYYSYQEEGFYFLNPHIIDGLFGFRKGVIIYTPLMLLAFIGLFLLKRNSKFRLPVSVFIIINTYIILSWWCWWYGGSLGNRAFIESYAIMAIPLAAFIKWMLKQKQILKFSLICILIIASLIGTFHTVQYHYGAIHWDSMTKAAYFDSFGNIRPSGKFQSLIKAPNYKNAKKGLKEYSEKQTEDTK